MLRGENVVCGTTTTGTGTLTLAATPAKVGASDFDVLARALGFGNNAAVLTSYTLIEYVDSTFAQPLQMEKGIGTLTLGASSGISNATLARTTVQQTATGLNSQPATYSVSSPGAITIGTAANALVFIGVGAVDVPAFPPYFDASGTISASDTFGVPPLSIPTNQNSTTGNLATNTAYYGSFVWVVPMLAKRATVFVSTAYAGGSPVSNAYFRIYDIATSGRPGKLLYDFGLLGSAGASLNSTGAVSTGAGGSGFLMLPGDYYSCLVVTLSGGVTPPQVRNGLNSIVSSGRTGTFINTAGRPTAAWSFNATDTGGATPSDPASMTSVSMDTYGPVAFALNNA